MGELGAFIFGSLASELTVSFWPGHKMLDAIGRLAGAEHHLKSARLWVDGCHTMIAQGVPSPLAEAEAQVELRSRARENAAAELQHLGYRARFTRAPEHLST